MEIMGNDRIEGDSLKEQIHRDYKHCNNTKNTMVAE
ncbi:protein of unknown function [Maridesulfovibrio hydrothermalis AM13 = DSM 14728]|uniref:Uncharacterized protein n=1 Tax=Maridesulfovibrio hydrothermalis AM13 = DSM 14728 TaxID=1121451 RepID=L0R980_9BACT|nr:protein of unknown function [Maridesulfovibrio hydrothermalis AM13 = DSM 14728]